MVETWRWPKASYSVLSINWGEMPKRAAVSRSYDHLGLQSAILLIAVDVHDDRDGFQLLEHVGRKGDQVLQVVAAHGELIEGGAIASADAQVLGGLQIERGAGDPCELGPQPLR